MEWLIAGLLIGYVLGKKRRVPSGAIADGVERLKTRSAAAVILSDKARAVVREMARQVSGEQISLGTLAELTNTIGDLGNIAGDMIDDQVVLLREVSNGRT